MQMIPKDVLGFKIKHRFHKIISYENDVYTYTFTFTLYFYLATHPLKSHIHKYQSK